MKRILIKAGKFGLSLACMFCLTAPAFAQASLTKALDFDDDDKADFTVFRPGAAAGTWWVLKSAGWWQAYEISLSLNNRDYFTPGDYDGDGKAEYSLWKSATGTWYQYRTATGVLAQTVFGEQGDEPAARDYDGDGRTDLAVVSRIHGIMYWKVKRSIDGVEITTQFGTTEDVPVPGDYDGDMKFDRAFMRPGAGHHGQNYFHILPSAGGSVQITAWGLGDDKAVPGDYDGDNKTDIAIVRDGKTSSDNLIWHILQSQAGYRSEAFGSTGSDKAVQADYDGDGKTDIAVWRDHNGTFYVHRSLDGVFWGVTWGLYGDFPIAHYDTH